MATDQTSDKTSIINLLCDAIRGKKRISFNYHDKERIGEPQCCGITTAGKEAVRVHLIKGGDKPEQLLR